uniref:Uncharacterized protein n=1 Tax=Ditylenchus dipsaci TaxID=166011 RepID=A0A915EV41_9BILA
MDFSGFISTIILFACLLVCMQAQNSTQEPSHQPNRGHAPNPSEQFVSNLIERFCKGYNPAIDAFCVDVAGREMEFSQIYTTNNGSPKQVCITAFMC